MKNGVHFEEIPAQVYMDRSQDGTELHKEDLRKLIDQLDTSPGIFMTLGPTENPTRCLYHVGSSHTAIHADNHCATWECGFSVLGSSRPGPQLHNFPLKKPAVRPDVGRDQREPTTMAYLNWGREPIQPAAVQNRKTSLTWKLQILLSISNSECLDE